jgi:hypothetical protein
MGNVRMVLPLNGLHQMFVGEKDRLDVIPDEKILGVMDLSTGPDV